jgi:hypothetical protein
MGWAATPPPGGGGGRRGCGDQVEGERAVVVDVVDAGGGCGHECSREDGEEVGGTHG